MSAPMSIVVYRGDRLGDVLLSLPSVVFLKANVGDQHPVFFSTQPIYYPLLKSFLQTHSISWIDSNDTSSLLKHTCMIQLNFDPSLSKKMYFSRVPLRIGPLSKPLSYIFFNHGLRQKRSLAKKNEGIYCLDLIQHALKTLNITIVKPILPPLLLPLHQPSKETILLRLQTYENYLKKPFVILHPGMGGSSENLSPQSYASLIEYLVERNIVLLITEGPSKHDREMIQALNDLLLRHRIPIFSDLTLLELGELFRISQLVIAPGTGPLHLAHWVGTPSLGLFSPVQSEHPRRWTPYGNLNAPTFVWLPKVQCPAKKHCLGTRCQHYFCMDSFNGYEQCIEIIKNNPKKLDNYSL